MKAQGRLGDRCKTQGCSRVPQVTFDGLDLAGRGELPSIVAHSSGSAFGSGGHVGDNRVDLVAVTLGVRQALHDQCHGPVACGGSIAVAETLGKPICRSERLRSASS